MVARFPDNTHVRMLAGITALSTPDLAAEIEEFFSVPRVRQGQKTLDQHLERLLAAGTVAAERALEKAQDREAFARTIQRLQPNFELPEDLRA
jgi:hypothetical protein